VRDDSNQDLGVTGVNTSSPSSQFSAASMWIYGVNTGQALVSTLGDQSDFLFFGAVANTWIQLYMEFVPMHIDVVDRFWVQSYQGWSGAQPQPEMYVDNVQLETSPYVPFSLFSMLCALRHHVCLAIRRSCADLRQRQRGVPCPAHRHSQLLPCCAPNPRPIWLRNASDEAWEWRPCAARLPNAIAYFPSGELHHW